MESTPVSGSHFNPEAEAFAQGVIEAVAQQRLPELFAGARPEALYRLPDRNGVSVVVLRTPALTEEQLRRLLKYRMAQYLAVHFVDPQTVYEARVEHEPLTNVSPDDVHVIAGCAETGEILCYAVIRAAPELPAGTTLRAANRPLLPTEALYGWGIFNRLRILPDLPVANVREIGRFVKNQRLPGPNELSARGPVEVGVALFHTLTGPLRMEVDAFIGTIEEGVAGQNLAFFHVPLVMIRSTAPSSEDAYLLRHYEHATMYPFAALVSDLSEAMRVRLPAIERALEQRGKHGLLALFALKGEASKQKSSLEPRETHRALIDAPLPQRGVAMQTRGEMVVVGDRLRQFTLFSGLSAPEATTLGTFLERVVVQAGDVIVRQWEEGDCLFLIESGEAAAQFTDASGKPVRLRTMGAGDYFGEIALITGAARTADVIALTPMTLLKLTRQLYTRYLSHAAEVEQELARTAAKRATDSIRKGKSLDNDTG